MSSGPRLNSAWIAAAAAAAARSATWRGPTTVTTTALVSSSSRARRSGPASRKQQSTCSSTGVGAAIGPNGHGKARSRRTLCRGCTAPDNLVPRSLQTHRPRRRRPWWRRREEPGGGGGGCNGPPTAGALAADGGAKPAGGADAPPAKSCEGEGECNPSRCDIPHGTSRRASASCTWRRCAAHHRSCSSSPQAPPGCGSSGAWSREGCSATCLGESDGQGEEGSGASRSPLSSPPSSARPQRRPSVPERGGGRALDDRTMGCTNHIWDDEKRPQRRPRRRRRRRRRG